VRCFSANAPASAECFCGATLDEAPHVLPADQRNVLAEARAVEIEQTAPMLHLLARMSSKTAALAG
jgi:hypothetical protein